MLLFLSGALAALFFMLAMYFHDFQISRVWEVIFLGLALTLAFIFEWLLHTH